MRPPPARLRQVVLPDLVCPDDLAGIFGVTPQTARRWVRRGYFGPFARVGSRLVLRRDSVLLAIEDAEEDPRGFRLLAQESTS